MDSQLLPYKNSFIHYLKWGTGTRLLICLHGYGEDSASFAFLAGRLGNDYTIYAIDLPHHGKTVWNEGLDFSPGELQQIITEMVPLELQTISLLGYSMGGRIALSLLQAMPERIERAVLVAPDGIHRNFWYWFSTQTVAGNRLFRYTMRNPKWFFGGMKFLMGFRLLNRSIFRFAHSYLDDGHEREKLYRRWTTLRRFRPDSAVITAILNKQRIPVRMLFGRYDRVIVAERSARLDQANDTIQVKVIKAGHQLLKEKYATDISVLFYE